MLANCTALRVLHLNTCHMLSSALALFIPSTMSRLSAPGLERFSFGFFGLGIEEWRRLDYEQLEHALTGHRFPNIKQVLFRTRADFLHRRGPGQCTLRPRIIWPCDEVRERLPCLTARKLLTFDSDSCPTVCYPHGLCNCDSTDPFYADL